MRRLAALPIAVGLLPIALPAAAATPRAADALSGRVVSAQGRWHHDHGRLSVRLVPGSGSATRHLVLRLVGVSCAKQRACVRLQGRLAGTITAVPGTHPDVGRRFSIAARGQVAPLGAVRASGGVTGTGSIARGRVTMRLTLSTAHGSIAVTASSGLVPGFTSP
jgi:hypothetical protein